MFKRNGNPNEKWTNDVDPASLQSHEEAAYHAWIESARTARKLYEAFLSSVQHYAEPGFSVKANNMRGTLNMCFNASDAPKAAPAGKAKINLAEFIARRQANGENV